MIIKFEIILVFHYFHKFNFAKILGISSIIKGLSKNSYFMGQNHQTLSNYQLPHFLLNTLYI